MASGKTFRLGKMLVNVSQKGIATKDTDSGEIRRYMFPWVQAEAAPTSAPQYDESQDYDEAYDDQGYDQQYDDQYDEPEYEDGEYYAEEDEYDDQAATVMDEPWFMWAALVLLPPLGIWLLWKHNRFEMMMRGIISAVSAVWFIILLVLLFSSLGNNDDPTKNPPLVTPSPSPTIIVTPSPSPTPTSTPVTQRTPVPSATPVTGSTPIPGAVSNPAVTNAPQWVWSKEGGENYHNDQTCRGMQGATRVMLSVALTRGQTACPECFPTETVTKPTSTPLPAGSYYSTPNGQNYHSLPNCKGMTNAQVVTLAEAIARNQPPCPDCIGTVYITDGGSNYHSVSNCRGMQNAYLTTVANALDKGKTACPTCMNGTTGTTGNTGNTGSTGTTADGVYWYNPNGGSYYHKTSTCSGMKNAIQGSASAAENNGLAPCPTCLDGVSMNAKFWATTNGKHYHTKSNCTGMKNAVRITEATAISRGKTPCPECVEEASGGQTVVVTPGNTGGNTTTVTQTTTKYYSTPNGENFHSNPTCRGMAGATEVTAEQIAEREQTPCSKCIGTSGIYYSTVDGENYHSKANCRGMKGATIVTLAMINSRGQTPCPECIKSTGGTTETVGVTYYWATAGGKNFHSKSNCTGMKGATKITAEDAEKRGQTPCPTCVGSVFGTPDGKHYHKDRNCTGMKNATYMTILAAEKSGKTACPKCIPGASTPTPAPQVTPKPGEDDEDGSLYYYSREGGSYYHRVNDCTGMRNPDKVSEATAIARGQKPCPTCIGSVYATERGDHYHSDPTCSGMNGAKLVTIDTAELRGQTPCPTCLDGDGDAPVENGGAINPATTTVYCTLTGRYYHSYQYCSDMKHAGPVTLAWALDPAYEPCPDCKPPLPGTVDEDETMVYCTLNGEYYHSKKNCSGMRNAADVPLSWALDPGFRPCKECNPPKV